MVFWSWPWKAGSSFAAAPGARSRSLPTLICLAIALSTPVAAQNNPSLLPSAASESFPACGLTCSLLNEAATGCLPPAAPVTNQATYVSCFCSSAYLTPFKTSPDGTCDDTCTVETDRTELQTWYIDFCNSGGATGTSDSNTSGDQGNTGDSTNSNDPSTSSSAAAAPSRTPDPVPQSWWDGHYKWVIMIIVLAVGFTGIALLGLWLKRRHDAKYPNLYHGAGGASDSRIFNRPNDASPVPGAIAPMTSRRHDANTLSIASSSRTDVMVPKTRPGPAPSRLQKSAPGPGIDDIEIREIPR